MPNGKLHMNSLFNWLTVCGLLS